MLSDRKISGLIEISPSLSQLDVNPSARRGFGCVQSGNVVPKLDQTKK